MLAIGDQGSAELTRGHSLSDPAAVYPTWEYGTDDIDVLVEMLANPAGESPECDDLSVPLDERPVRGQEHRVVIIRSPIVSTGPGRKFVRLLQELQEEYPQAIIHVHGLYSFRVMFGLGFGAVDVDPRESASKGSVELPNGTRVTRDQMQRVQQWVHVLGFAIPDLAEARQRCMFNMKSALWAAAHYRDNIKFKSRDSKAPLPIDPNAPLPALPATTNGVKSQSTPATVGDKFLCNTCSLQDTCKYFRSGGVCSIPESEPAALAHFFKTRNADTIIEGLGTVLAVQTRRLEQGLQDEELTGELDPEVTKIAHGLFDRGVKLAKLVDAELAAAGAPRTAVQVNVGNASAQGLTAGIVAELEARGIRREDITPAMIMQVIEGNGRPALEAVASVVNE